VLTRDGQLHAVDAIICGTGFRVTDVLSPLTVTGLGGRDLNTDWRAGIEAYLGTMISGYPNLYMMMGPNTGLGHSSMVFMIEAQIRMALRVMGGDTRAGAPTGPTSRRARSDDSTTT
jgi:cation diffusion facilitator CzcD-associated flavoprotein CzcO